MVRRLFIVVAASLGVASCVDNAVPVAEPSVTETALPSTSTSIPTSTSTSAAPVTTTSEPGADTSIEWSVVDEDSGSVTEEGYLVVPLDHDNLEAGTIELYVVRHRRAEPTVRIGSLLVNPGGPGSGGSDLALFAEQIYGPAILDHFDIVGFDPRGTGLSEPGIDCVDEYDPYFGLDTGPDDEGEETALQAALAEFAAGCDERSGELLEHVTTADAARDLDLLRRALGEDEISYFGWSYGTLLGATWATLFPETVRAAVLDGAVNPTVGRIDGLVEQAAGFEATLGLFLEDCAGNARCAFHNGGDPGRALDDLLARIEIEEIPTARGRHALSSGVVEIGIANALYDDAAWPGLARDLADAAAGDGSGLLAQYDAYNVRLDDGTYPDDLEAYFAISCADDPSTGGVAEAIGVRPRFLAASPRIGTTTAAEVMMCALWPPLPADPVAITGARAGPIVVVGNTGDPATPFEGSRRMADTLAEGVFVAVEANQHTAYGLNGCIDDLIEAYLVDLTVPPSGTEC